MELLEFEEEQEINAPIDFHDGDNYDNTDLFCEGDDHEDNDLCSSYDENPIAALSNHADNSVKKNDCQLCGCRISNKITTDLDVFEWYFHVFQWFNGAPAHFSTCFTWSIFVISWHFCDQGIWKKSLILINFKSHSICFSRKVRCPKTMAVDEDEDANRLIDQILDLQKTLDHLRSGMDDAWKFPLSGLIKNRLFK